MSHLLKSVLIKGFLGKQEVNFDLFDDVTFLTGRNGTGKTVAIKIVRACLALDIDVIAALPFQRCRLSFQSQIDKRLRPFIQVDKLDGEEQTLEISYRVEGESADSISLEVGRNLPSRFQFRERLLLRNPRWSHSSAHEPAKLDRLRKALTKMVPFSWLPLQRIAFIAEDETGRDKNQPIDSKITELLSALAGYLSSMDTKYGVELDRFQEHYLTSIFDVDYNKLNLAAPTFDVEREAEQFNEIFSAFSFEGSDVQGKIARYFTGLEEVVREQAKEEVKFTFEAAIRYVDANRAHRYIDQWQNLQRKRDEIYEIKEKFVGILSDMYVNKSVDFDARNRLVVFNESGDIVARALLSSGEKQLFILLAETVLQERSGYLFIADEPELSLHLEWQIELVESIIALNPNCQMLFATHSPEVIGRFKLNAIDMEELQ